MGPRAVTPRAHVAAGLFYMFGVYQKQLKDAEWLPREHAHAHAHTRGRGTRRTAHPPPPCYNGSGLHRGCVWVQARA